jgi:hypothetical protein
MSNKKSSPVNTAPSASVSPIPLSEISYIAGDSWKIQNTQEESDDDAESGFLYLGAEKGEEGWRVVARGGAGSGRGHKRDKIYDERLGDEEAVYCLREACAEVEKGTRAQQDLTYIKTDTPWFCNEMRPHVTEVLKRLEAGESFNPAVSEARPRVSPPPPAVVVSVPPLSLRQKVTGLFADGAKRIAAVKRPVVSKGVQRLAGFFGRSANPGTEKIGSSACHEEAIPPTQVSPRTQKLV